MSTIHAENFVSIRTLHPRISWRPSVRYQPKTAETDVEIDYRDLLSEANEAFFNREYPIALRLYLELRNKIMIQSHPELPRTPSVLDDLVIDVDFIDFDRIAELARRILIDVEPGDDIVLPIDPKPWFSIDEITPNPNLTPFGLITVDPTVITPAAAENSRRRMRELALRGELRRLEQVATRLAASALKSGNPRVAADVLAESAALIATYAKDNREAMLTSADASFNRAKGLYQLVGDVNASEAMDTNLRQLGEERGVRPLRPVRPGEPTINISTPRGPISLNDINTHLLELGAIDRTSADVRELRLPTPVTTRIYLAPDADQFRTALDLVESVARASDEKRSVGVMTADGAKVISLASDRFRGELETLYINRRNATTIAELNAYDAVATTFVAYIPHLFFYVLPMAIADTYVELGRYNKAGTTYASVLKYPFLNPTIEIPDLWRRMATAQLRHGDELFRQQATGQARAHYETIVNLPGSVPTGSPLYSPSQFATMSTQAGEVVNDLLDQPHNPVNPKVAEIVTRAFLQLTKIDNGLNYLGLSGDFVPVQRFRYLQAAANYLADNAIQAERTYIQFRSQAERQKFERIQLENAVDLNQAAVDVEQKRLEDSALDYEAARETRELTELRRANAQANLHDWQTMGWELATVNMALSWASNAANDKSINYSGIYYQGERHDYSGDVEDFYDTVGEWREWLNYDLQRNRYDRQVAETNAEVTIAQTRESQALVRHQVQVLSHKLALERLAGSQEVLVYAEERMFDEDLWFRLASDMADLARSYLDMAIEVAFVMERAYDLEFDRDLGRIRLDYGIGGPEGLLGGDQLKRDIASFTLDYIQHGKKHNPIRVPLSLREEFPHAFNTFQQTGRLNFRTDLEMFDRRFPGTFQRRIKRVEVFVEGLIPPAGVHGSLVHEGLSTEWRHDGTSWVKHHRVHPIERMVVSSYQHRRDLAVIQPPDELLALFENLGPQGNWELHLPLSANDLDYGNISDIKLVLYLDSDGSPDLETHTKALYGPNGGKAFVLSSRFHYPDQYFRLDRDRQVAFDVPAQRLPAYVTNPALDGFAVTLVAADGDPPLAGRTLTITRGSDTSSVTAITDADGVVRADAATMAPFASWKGASPADTWTIAFAAGDDVATVIDVQLGLSYAFTYRADGPTP